MAAPASEELRELERLLVVAAETGEPRSFESLREELGLGHEDLTSALGVLREHGKASEEAPGAWTGGAFEAGPVAEPEPRVVVHEDGARIGLSTEPEFLGGRGAVLAGEANVRLTRSIADALDAAALGQIVKAGLDGTEAGEAFTLEVLP